jgi:large subunit ribosomal protein L4
MSANIVPPSAAIAEKKEFDLPVRNAEGKEVDRVVVDAARLDKRVRPRLLKEAIVMYQANKRVGTHETKTRSDVWRSNKKPWRQKGTGRARAGTARSPLWRGGGIIFGPHPRDYSFAIPKQKRWLALRSALYSKFRDGEVMVVDELKVEAPRTRYVAGVLRSLGVNGRCLIGTAAMDKNLVLSTRNIPRVLIAPVDQFNALDVMAARTLLLTREALELVLAGRRRGAKTEPASPEGPEKKGRTEEVKP